jgi:uncharacterized MAPEG superfamily protein
MTPELTALALAGLLQVAQFNLELGTRYTSSSRDRPPERPLSTLTGRLQRAMNNHFEGLILFTLAVVVVTLSDQSTPVTRTAAWVYLGARVLYIPAYAWGWSPWRSVIWGIGLVATLTLLFAALF